MIEANKHGFVVAKVLQKVISENKSIKRTKCDLLIRRYIELEVCKEGIPEKEDPSDLRGTAERWQPL